MKPIVIVGAILVLLGLLGLAMPEFTTHETKNVVALGDLKIQANEPTQHTIPPIVSAAAIVVGAVLLGSGLYRKE
jgi:hypothetical protein